MKNKFRLITLLFVLILSSKANAGLILGATEQIVNVDLAALDNSLMSSDYSSVTVLPTWSADDLIWENGESFYWRFYGDLDGVNLIQTRTDSWMTGTGPYSLTTANTIFDAMLDGIMSFGFATPIGSGELASFRVCGNRAGSPQFCADIDLSSDMQPVPEPFGLSLFLLGLAGLVARRTY